MIEFIRPKPRFGHDASAVPRFQNELQPGFLQNDAEARALIRVDEHIAYYALADEQASASPHKKIHNRREIVYDFNV